MSASTVTGDELYGRAREALQSGKPIAALDLIAAARSAYLDAGSELMALRTDLGRINVLDDLGRHNESVAVAASLIEALANTESAEVELAEWMRAAAHENSGASLGCLGQHEAAATHLHQASTLYANAGADSDRARVLGNLAVERLELGDPETAIDLLEQAQSMLDAAGEQELAKRCLVYIARAHSMAGRYAAAVETLRHASGLGDVDGLDGLRTQLSQAEVYASLRLWPELRAIVDDIGSRLDQAGMERDRAVLRLLESEALLALGDVVASADEARRALQTFTELDLPGWASAARLTLASATPDDDVAVEQIAIAYDTYEGLGERWGIASAATIAAERSAGPDIEYWLHRASEADATMYPDLAWRNATARGQRIEEAGDFAGAVVCYRSALDGLRTLRVAAGDDQLRLPFMRRRRAPLERLLDLTVGRGDVIEARALTSEERAWSLRADRRDKPAAPTPNSLLFQMIDDRLVAFVTTVDLDVHLVRLKIDAAHLLSAQRQLQSHWRRIADPRMRVHLGPLAAACEQQLQHLYLALFAPLEQHLSRTEPVVVIPTASTAGIPMHALHDGLGFVADTWDIRVAPMEGMAGTGPSQAGRTLVVGVADAYAPAIEREAEQIAEITDGTLLMNRAASAGAVREAVADHDVIHIACHGRFRPENPSLSSLELADGPISAGELADWDLSGTLVSLAACSSGRQHPAGEDESLGLPRALLSAGATAVVMNLWPVDDEVSVGIQSNFHLQLRTQGPHVALRHAQRQAADNFTHPLLWGSSVVYGAPSLPSTKNAHQPDLKGQFHA